MGRGLAGAWKPLFSSRGIQRSAEEGVKRSAEVGGLLGGMGEDRRRSGRRWAGRWGCGCRDLASWIGLRGPRGLGVCRAGRVGGDLQDGGSGEAEKGAGAVCGESEVWAWGSFGAKPAQ